MLTADDLASVIDEITPLRVAIGPRRVITLGRPTRVELVAGFGLRVRGAARFTWDAYGLVIPVTLRAWQVLLVPSLQRKDGRNVLDFDPRLEELEFKSLPMFVDAGIASAVKDGLAAQRGKLAWDFEKHLSLLEPLPKSMSPSGDVKLGPTGGSVVVTASEVRLTLDFALHVTHSVAGAAPVISPCTRVTVAPKNTTWAER